MIDAKRQVVLTMLEIVLNLGTQDEKQQDFINKLKEVVKEYENT